MQNARTIALRSRVIDAGLMAVLFLAPLFMGGRHPLGRLVLSVIVWVMLLAALSDSRPRFNGAVLRLPAVWVSAAAVLIVFLQLVPLSNGALRLLSPSQNALLPLWQPAATVEPPEWAIWKTVSLVPTQTALGFCSLLTYIALFWVASSRMRETSDVQRMLRMVALAGICFAVIGWLQFIFGNGKFLWVYDHPSRSTEHTIKGTFANQNHFAHALALTAAPLLGWIEAARRQGTRSSAFRVSGNINAGRRAVPVWMLVVGAILVVSAAVFTFSRGGMAVVGLAIAISLLAFRKKRKLSPVAWMGGLVTVLAMTLALSIYGYDRWAGRVAELTNDAQRESGWSARRLLWSAVSDAISNFWLLGTGVGSHSEVYPTYLSKTFSVEFTHAENGYLQVCLETGFVGFSLLVMTIGLAVHWLRGSYLACSRSASSERSTVLCLGIGLTVSALHAFVDFAWYVPACMSITVLLLAGAFRMSGLLAAADCAADCSGEDPKRDVTPRARSAVGLGSGRPLAMGLAMACLAAFCLSLQFHAAHASLAWDAYLRQSLAIQDRHGLRGTSEARKQHSNQALHTALRDTARIGGRDRAELIVLEGLLQQVVDRDPSHARGHARLATTLLRRFELEQQTAANPMSLDSIRDAAVASKFASRNQLERWLSAATGERYRMLDRAWWHACQAVALSPMQGKMYLHLSDLAFLVGRSSLEHALSEQALAVRPFSGEVLYAAGSHAARQGDVATAVDYYRLAFDRDPAVQMLVIERLAPQLSPDSFVSVFRPNSDGLQKMLTFYRDSGNEPSARWVALQYAKSLQTLAQQRSGLAAAELWNSAQQQFGYLGRDEDALVAARHAVAAEPNNVQWRYVLARRLEQIGDLAGAEQAYQWCQFRRPRSETIEDDLKRVAFRRAHAETRQ